MMRMSGLQGLCRDGHAGDQTAATDRNDEHLKVRHRLQHLECDGALACDDQRIVVGMNQRQAAGAAMVARKLACFFERLAGNDDLRPVMPRVLDLHHRRANGHDDAGGNTEPLGVVGDTLCVIARRHRNDAARPRLGRQRAKAVERTALLEG